MTVRATRHAGITDADITLREIDAGIETAPAIELGVRVQRRDGPYWGAQANSEAYKIAVVVSVLQFTGDESYAIHVFANQSFQASGAIELLSVPVKSTGSFTISVDCSAFDSLFPNATDLWISTGIVMSGTSPACCYGATLQPND